MEQAHKKRPPRATANSPPVLPDMGKLLYKSGKFISQINRKRTKRIYLNFHRYSWKPNHRNI